MILQQISLSFSRLNEHLEASVAAAFVGYIDNNAPLLNEAQIAQVRSALLAVL